MCQVGWSIIDNKWSDKIAIFRFFFFKHGHHMTNQLNSSDKNTSVSIGLHAVTVLETGRPRSVVTCAGRWTLTHTVATFEPLRPFAAVRPSYRNTIERLLFIMPLTYVGTGRYKMMAGVCLSVRPSVCLSVACLNLTRERKGLGTRKPKICKMEAHHRSNQWTYLEVKRSKGQRSRSHVTNCKSIADSCLYSLCTRIYAEGVIGTATLNSHTVVAQSYRT